MITCRYERELEGGSRPPLRLITTQDAPPTGPMVFCISNITWKEGGVTEDGFPLDAQPHLELTDGWYRLRAEVDEPMARAARRGVLCVGRKIAVAGARVSPAYTAFIDLLLILCHSLSLLVRKGWKCWMPMIRATFDFLEIPRTWHLGTPSSAFSVHLSSRASQA